MPHHFRLATPADDAALRARMAADWLQGQISVSFRREPHYFAGAPIMGETAQIVVCENEAQQIVALGSRFTRQAYLNGIPTRTGYLADLRGAPEVRRGTLLARGFQFLRALHQADPVSLYTTVILDGNQTALDALSQPRAGLPQYRPLGRMLTPALHLDLPCRVRRQPGVQVRPAGAADLERVVAFLQHNHARRQFAPVWDQNALTAAGNGRLRIEDFWLAERNGGLLAVVAAWDQSHWRQTHLEAYSPSLARLRPFYNLAARFLPLKALPALGSRIPYLVFSAAAVDQDDPEIFSHLLAVVCNALRRGPWHYAICGLHERDPLATVLADFRRIPAAGLLFVVHYADAVAAFDALDARVPYLDFGLV